MKTKTKTIGVLLAAFFAILVLPRISHAAFDYQLMEQIPGFFNSGSSPTFPQLLTAIYNFGLWTVGIAAFFMLVIGGFLYITSAGNTSAAGTAKKVITDALLGLVAAFLAYLLLYVINPDLVNLNLNLISVGINSQGVSYADQASATNGGPAGTCQNCVSVADICKESPCSLNATLATKLRTALNGRNARITEGFPPTVKHISKCHNNGTCADVNLTVNKGDPKEVKKLQDALKSAGLNPVYESNNCNPYTAVGVYCKNYSTMTSPSFHVNM